MKIKSNKYISIVAVVLVVCTLLLVLFPIKTAASTPLYAYSDGETNSIKLNNQSIVTQNFISTAYDMSIVTLAFNLVSDNPIEGNILLEIYDKDGIFITGVSKDVKGLSVTGSLLMTIPNQNQTYSKEYQLVLKYTGTDGITFYTEKSNGKDNIIVDGEKNLESSLSVSYFGEKKDYFFVWYPLVVLLLLMLISSVGENGGEK